MAKIATLRTAEQPRQMADIPPPTPKPVIRTAEGLRNVLFDEIDRLRDGTGDRRRAVAVAQLCAQIVNVAKVEVEYQRHLALMGREGFNKLDEAQQLGVLKLGT